MLCNIKTKLNFQPAVSFLKENIETKNASKQKKFSADADRIEFVSEK